jgi:hypothetical protein
VDGYVVFSDVVRGDLRSPCTTPTYFPMSQDGIDSAVGKRCPFMCRLCLFLLQRLKGSMSCNERDFNKIEMRAAIKFFFFLQGKEPKEIYAILKKH